MDEICKTLSQKLSEAGVGVYTVFYEDELLDALPEENREPTALEEGLKKLNGGGYIDLRYARGAAYCLAYLRPYETELPQPAPATEESQTLAVSGELSLKSYLLVAASAFFGGMGGGLLVLLAAVL